MKKDGLVWGIYLGDEYCSICYCDKDGLIVPVSGATNSVRIPTFVRYLPDDPEYGIVGETARDSAILYADYTISYPFSQLLLEELKIGFSDDEKIVPVEKVITDIIRKIIEEAYNFSGIHVENVVVSIPDYKNAFETEKVRKACLNNNLNVLDIIWESVAGLCFYSCLGENTKMNVCVFNLSGNFSVSVMSIYGFAVERLCFNYDNSLCGHEWTNEIKKLIISKFCDMTGCDCDFDEEFEQELEIKSETTKIKLIKNDSAAVCIKLDSAHRARVIITRCEFDSSTSFLLMQAVDKTRDTINWAIEHGVKIDKIILVGDGSSMPQVINSLHEEFSIPSEYVETDLAIAKGAAMYARMKCSDYIKIQNKKSYSDLVKEIKEYENRLCVLEEEKRGLDLNIKKCECEIRKQQEIIELHLRKLDGINRKCEAFLSGLTRLRKQEKEIEEEVIQAFRKSGKNLNEILLFLDPK